MSAGLVADFGAPLGEVVYLLRLLGGGEGEEGGAARARRRPDARRVFLTL